MSRTAKPDVWSIDSEMTIYTAAALAQTLQKKLTQSKPLTIDLAQVPEMDTAGFQILLLAKHEAEKAGKELHLRHPSQGVADVLAMFHAQHLVKED